MINMRNTITLILLLISFSNCYSQTATKWIDSADSKFNLEDYIGAVSDYSKALKLAPNSAHSFHYRGHAKSNLGDQRGAIADYTESIRIYPDDPIVYYYRGLAKVQLKDYQGAIADYDISVALNPDNPDVYYSRALIKIHTGQKDSGCLDLSKSGELGDKRAYEAIVRHCN